MSLIRHLTSRGHSRRAADVLQELVVHEGLANGTETKFPGFSATPTVTEVGDVTFNGHQGAHGTTNQRRGGHFGVLLLFILSLAGSSAAQPFRVPPYRTVAELGACVDGKPKLVAVTDGASASDCSTGGGATEVFCYCKGGAWSAAASSSGVTSAGLTAPADLLSVSGSPITSSGTFTLSKVSQAVGLVYAGPSSGSAAAPGFRALVDADIPNAITIDSATHASTADTATTAAGVAADSVPLITATTGDFVAGVTAGGGLTKTGTEGASLGLTPCGSDGQIPKYTAAGGWACASDSGGAGDVAGPASATADAAAVFDGTTGKLVKNSTLLVTATGIRLGGSGPYVKTFGGGIVSFTTDDATVVWAQAQGEGFRAWDSGGTIKATVTSSEISLASDRCLKAASSVGAGGGDTTLCRTAAGAWGTDGLRLIPRASPIVTCGNANTLGYEYTDDSGAKCWCNGTAWVVVAGSGSCS